GQDKESVQRFTQEAQTASRLNHPNIIRVLGHGQDRGRHYLVMEYVEGRSAAQRLARQGPMDIPRAVETGIQAARGLQYAHDAGVVHRDVKPSNLLLHVDGAVKIADLGIAQQITAGAADAPGLVGTPAYASPEQASQDSATPRSDIYALGATLFHLITGAPPYKGASACEVIRQHLSSPPPPLRQFRPDAPEGLEAVLLKMMAKSPASRYATMREVEQDLEAVQRGEAPAALNELRAARKDGRRGRRAGFLVAGAGSLLLGAGVLALVFSRHSRAPGPAYAGPVLLMGEIWRQDANLPLPDVLVTLEPSGPAARTGPDGGFRLLSPHGGVCSLRFQRQGYATARLSLAASTPRLWTGSFYLASLQPPSALRRQVLDLSAPAPDKELAPLGLRLVGRDAGGLTIESPHGLAPAGAAWLSSLHRAPPAGYTRRLSGLAPGACFFLRAADGACAKAQVLAPPSGQPLLEIVTQINGAPVFPEGPSGVSATWEPGCARLVWEAVPAAERYEVWVRDPGGPWQRLQSTLHPYFLDRSAAEGSFRHYGVSAHGASLGDTSITEVPLFAGPPGLLLCDASLDGVACRFNVIEGRASPEANHITFFRDGPSRVLARAASRGGARLVSGGPEAWPVAPATGYTTAEIPLPLNSLLFLRLPDGRFARVVLREVTPNSLIVESALQTSGSTVFPVGPSGLTATRQDGKVQLRWEPAPAPTPQAWRVWSRAPGKPWALLGVTSSPR
ncbi:MAG TPA: serine/threonine-protein kinase, partial [Candidatus Brocadiia bacterium]|nr:serine/threonine-protein kinase [Candidatus Brocadiia bacterium]